MKPKLGVFSFTSCEGCQLQILNLEDELLALLNSVEIVNFREAIDEKRQDYDIAFVEGSITTSADEKEVIDIRSKAKIVISIGSCACIGGINALKNSHPMDFCQKTVYSELADNFRTFPTRRIGDVIKVDYEINGCPISKKEFLDVTKKLLLGVPLKLPNYAVCTECKMAGNPCMFQMGHTCLGAITRGGCEAICPSFGDPCHGCRGFMDGANIKSMVQILRENGLTEAQIKNQFSYFNGTKTLEEHLA